MSKLPRWVWKNEEGRRGWFFETKQSVPHLVIVRLATSMLPRIRQLCDSVQGLRREEYQLASEILSQWVALENTILQAGLIGIDRDKAELEIMGESTFKWLREQMKTYRVVQYVVNPAGAKVLQGMLG